MFESCTSALFKHWNFKHQRGALSIKNFEFLNLTTSAADVRQPMVAEVCLFQVAEAPTNMYDCPIPKKGFTRSLCQIDG